jgi:hypothetical protein
LIDRWKTVRTKVASDRVENREESERQLVSHSESEEADALALPSFTYGVDIMVLVGKLHIGRHQTVDEVHHEVQ